MTAIVYRYYDEHDILIYVGVTARGHRRLAEHMHTQEWWPYVRQQEIDHFETYEEATAAEANLIAKHRPPYNTALNPTPKASREQYERWRGKIPDSMRFHDAMEQYGKTWDVGLSVDNVRDCVAILPPQYRPVMKYLEVEPRARVISRCGGIRLGFCEGEPQQFSASIMIPIRRKVGAPPPSHDGELRVKAYPKQRRFVATSIIAEPAGRST